MTNTLIFIKPDAVRKQHIGAILSRFEAAGLRIVGLNYQSLSSETAAKHYSEHVTKPFYPDLEKFITSGPVVIAILEGNNAVSRVRELCGHTDPRAASAGTIRADYGVSMTENAIHASDSPESAQKEIQTLYPEYLQ